MKNFVLGVVILYSPPLANALLKETAWLSNSEAGVLSESSAKLQKDETLKTCKGFPAWHPRHAVGRINADLLAFARRSYTHVRDGKR